MENEYRARADYWRQKAERATNAAARAAAIEMAMDYERLLDSEQTLVIPPEVVLAAVAMERRPSLTDPTAAKLMERAREYRDMAKAASTPRARNALSVLAIVYAVLAARQEVDGGQRGLMTC